MNDSMMQTAPFYPVVHKRCARLLIALLAFLLPSLAASATSYVNFSSGKTFVFPDSCVAQMANTGDAVMFTAIDGSVYHYQLSAISSITQEPIRPLPAITSFKFGKNLNYQVIADAAGDISENAITAQVAGIGKRLTATFELSDAEARLYCGKDEMQSAVSRLRYDGTRVLTVGYPGDLILSKDASGTCSMLPYGKQYAVDVLFLTDQATEVPRIDINTVGGVDISSKEYYIDAEIIIDGKGVFPSMTDSVQVKGRGNTSWTGNPKAKNPYRLKFASKVKPLGLTKGKSWVLLANRIQGSMLTNAYGMKAASLIGTAAPNHIIPVDLYVNGTYKGSYNFTEKVGLAGNSVDVDSENVAALLELDLYYDEADGQKFKSIPYNLPVNVKDPEFGVDETLLTLSDIKQRFNSFVVAAQNGDDLDQHVDIDYLARFLLTNELICNSEIFHPKSTFCYNADILDGNSKFIFGPVWDLDWAMGYHLGATNISYFNDNVTFDYYNNPSPYLGHIDFIVALRNDAKVGRRIYELCRDMMKNGLDELCEFCEDYYLYAKPSLEKNGTAPTVTDGTNYAVQSAAAAVWFRQRAEFIYAQIRQEQLIAGDVNDDGTVNMDDLTLLINCLLGEYGAFDGINADVDNDGDVLMDDLTSLINMLLGAE